MPVDEPIASLGNAGQKPCGKREALAHEETSVNEESLSCGFVPYPRETAPPP